MMIPMDPGLALVPLSLLPIIALSVWMITRKSVPLYTREQSVLDDVVRVVQENVTEKQRTKTMYSRMYASKSMSVPMSVNVVGQNLDDAQMTVDKYLDEATVSGFTKVRLIHGKGTGALKNALWQHLKKDRRVATFRIGQYGEGDGGVTIVELKTD